MVVVGTLDLMAAVALVWFVSGMGGVTYRAVLLLVQLIQPKPRWVQRGVLLVVLFVAYLVLIMLDVPSVLAAVRDGGESDATVESVVRTSIFGAWLWTLNTILLMLARGQLGARPVIRAGRR